MTRPTLYVYDDAQARTWEPFALTRPVGSLTAGVAALWSRWQMALQCPDVALVGAAHLAGFDDGYWPYIGTVPRMADGTVPAGSIIANARFAPAVRILDFRDGEPRSSSWRAPPEVGVWLAGDRIAAVRITRELAMNALADGSLLLEELRPTHAREDRIEGWWLDAPWDLVRTLPEMLADDIPRVGRGPTGRGDPRGVEPPPSHSIVVGEHEVLVFLASGKDDPVQRPTIEPHVVFDASAGPILIGPRTHLHAFTRITGPCCIGFGSTVLGGDISRCAIGPVCKVRGEMSDTIMLGWANKGHDGFVGHSILGRWSNLGAGTITSNLKNTYGTVSLWTPAGVRDTGMPFLGTLLGDHAKTGIGTRLTTGTVVGAGANVYGSAMPPKAVPPFAWGERPPYAVYRCDKFLEVAERVMARRKVTMSEGTRRQLAAAHAARWTVEDAR